MSFPLSASAPALGPSFNSHQRNNLKFILDNQYQYVILRCSVGAQDLSLLPEVMHLRRAVPKIPPKSSVSYRLPLYKNNHCLTHSESTLPQVLIPLHFNSPRISVYRKPGEGVIPRRPKVLQLVTIATLSCDTHSNANNSNHLYRLLYKALDTQGRGRHLRPILDFRISSFDLLISSLPPRRE